MKRLFAATALALSALPAAAQDCADPMIAIREDGMPIYTHQPPEVYQAIRDWVRPVMGDAPADRPILVIDYRTRQGAWVNRSLLKETVDVFDAALRDQLVYSGPDHCRPKDIPWAPFDPAKPGRGPIELPEGRPIPAPIDLFPDETAGQDPLSGLWRAEIGPTRMEGCPPVMQNAFPASAGALPGMTGDTRRMDFSSPFHPDTLELSRTAGVRWQSAGEGRWVTTDLAAETFAQIPAGQGGGSQIVWTLTVVSPEEMSFERAIEIVLPAEAAAIMGASPDGCRVTGTDRWIRVGD